MSGEGLKVLRIRCQDRSSRFCRSYNKGVNGRALSGTSTQQSGASCETFRNLLCDITRLEKAVGNGVSASMPLKALRENY